MRAKPPSGSPANRTGLSEPETKTVGSRPSKRSMVSSVANSIEKAKSTSVDAVRKAVYGQLGVVEVGAGVDFYQRTVPSIYRSLVDIDGTEIEQDLKLRQVPISATVRFLPLGRNAAVQPYIGAGVVKTFFGEVEDIDDEDLSVDEIEATGIGYIVNLGINVELMEQMGLLLDAKWSPSKGKATGILNDGTQADIEVSPLIISLGVSWRF